MNKPINNCPACDSELEWSNTYTDLFCRNLSCGAQLSRGLLHFFGVINNLDGFGPATLRILIDNGYDTIPKIYKMNYKDFEYCGYKIKTVMNLGTELELSKKRPIPDYRFLAALGIENLGIGSAKKFLEEYDILNIFDISIRELEEIEGFGNVIASNVYLDVNNRYEEIEEIFNIGFNIVKEEIEVTESKFTGKRLTFSGKMSGNRKEMENHAKSIGALITGVNSKSDFLIIGENVGANKISAAKKFGVKMLTENEYMEMASETS